MPGTPARLLPWVGPDGKTAYVIGDGTGPVSRLADEAEAEAQAQAKDGDFGDLGAGEGEDGHAGDE